MFKPGDKVRITNPQQPTNHQGGETGTVIHTETTEHGQLVQIDERGASFSVVWAHELTHDN
ncbi:hypothetical protein [Streptomyces sp. CB03911]|uniref:hypothetical protein n=1 Tax=Streptomyces sp. CB03911 TaxID=1804758 RepID=UPI00093B25EC|nr:hypothetical protein [Streptomyces sp. CB03911]OKI14194.1 hypothetical protein A6A07_13665 [Streptomyces sp. CB03911]